MDESPDLQHCLAYHVLTNRRAWLGRPSLHDLELVLAGASMRATLTSSKIAEWRIHGPLAIPDFYLPLVARTGHPTLSITWASALEFLHFDLEDASLELLRLMRDWSPPAKPSLAGTQENCEASSWSDLRGLLASMARRPGMFLGTDKGWALRCYLQGMSDGGDWLELPHVPDLRRVIGQIEQHSSASYGSSFAAYRVYDAASLLAWAGIEPL